MKKLLLLFFTILTLNAYSQYDDLYWDNGYHGTTYLTYDHFPSYSARINLFWGGLFYISYWSYYDRYWNFPYYYGNYYNNWYSPYYYSWNYPYYNNWYYNNNYTYLTIITIIITIFKIIIIIIINNYNYYY